MDAVRDTGIFGRREQETLNWYRHFKGVHSVGDMVCSNGHTINLNMLTQEAGQSLETSLFRFQQYQITSYGLR